MSQKNCKTNPVYEPQAITENSPLLAVPYVSLIREQPKSELKKRLELKKILRSQTAAAPIPAGAPDCGLRQEVPGPQITVCGTKSIWTQGQRGQLFYDVTYVDTSSRADKTSWT